ncbi:MAG: DUF1624 domain-containing protein [wastewater metagenome]|nr:DUF1624 domain-containing protein [Candidatus Loosdrechtia aerotolerans]
MAETHISRPAKEISVQQTHTRIESIDFLRGIVMVLMALDHIRDYFYDVPFDPTDLTQANTALFLTRWITHICAPVFFFLAGTGAFLSSSRKMTKPELSHFLLMRGLWLILIELTIIRFAWTFNLNYRYIFGQVIWTLGWSMIVLACLVSLPTQVITFFGIILIAGHNLFDDVNLDNLGTFSWLWRILHDPGTIKLSTHTTFIVLYPLIPWVGVMAVGYGFGTLFLLERNKRIQYFLRTGIILCICFVIMRAINLYGDPRPWSIQANWLFTFFSFINCEKYPPSLLFLLMTLGPAIIILAVLEKRLPRHLNAVFTIFGRVPLFYYICHFMLVHMLAVGFTYLWHNQKYYNLTTVYLVWILVIVLLFPSCFWFVGIKKRKRSAWLRYF